MIIRKILLIIITLLTVGINNSLANNQNLSNVYHITKDYNLKNDEGVKVNRLNINIEVKKNTLLTVKEEFQVKFLVPKHGIYRYIPLNYVVNNKVVDTLKIYDVKILRNNQMEPFKVSKENGNIIFKIGSAKRLVQDYQNYTIQYNAYGTVDFLNDKDLFLWNIVGSGFKFDILSTDFHIHFPPNFIIKRPYIYAGKEDDNTLVTNYIVNKNELDFQYNNIISYGNGISLYIDFDKGTFKKPSLICRLIIFVKEKFIDFLVIIFAGVFSLYSWIKYGKDDYVAIPAKYYPPKDMDPAVFGFLSDDNSSINEIISLVFYWASKGLIKISELEKSTKIIKLADLPLDSKEYETKFFNALFKNGDEVDLSKLKFNEDSGLLNFIYNNIEENVKKEGIYTESSIRMKNKMGCLSTVLGLMIFILCNMHLVSIFTVFFLFAVFGVLGRYMYKKTPKGNELYSEVKGFELFLKKVENPQIEVLMKNEVDYTSRVLPFAIACGVVNEFLKKMEALMVEVPSWYESNVNHVHSFRNVINRSISNMHTSLIPEVKNHSRGVTSGGGGFVGGGHGGGGGGSW